VSTIVTRAGKGSPLTNTEVDANFDNLNSDKYQENSVPQFGDVTIESNTPQLFLNDTDGNQVGVVVQNNNVLLVKSTGQTTYGGVQFKRGSPVDGQTDKFSINASSDGDIRFYNTDNAPKLFWDAQNAKLKVGANSNPAEVLDVEGNVKASGNFITPSSVECAAVNASGASTTGKLTARGGGSSPLTVNRNNANGTIIDLQANGVTKSVIGLNPSGEAFVRTDLGGMVFSQTGLRPTTTGYDGNDNAADLGTSTNRFKDLYLGGNANVSGEITCDTLASGVSTFTKSGASGTIAEFYNDTTKVGFITDRSQLVSSLVLDTREAGVGITASANRLIPTDLDGNVTSNIADLGGANDKWKSLYLGGGVYLGGDTAAANKLEDYEEGTWGPVFRDEVTGGNVASGQAFNGSYTRIGNQCTLHMRVINLNPAGVTGTNNVYITNLPFAASDESSNYRYVGSMESTRISYNGSIQPRITENTNYMVVTKTNESGSLNALKWDGIADNQADIYASITYTV
jgi:hypothetical protein